MRGDQGGDRVEPNEKVLELSLANDLSELAGVAARIETFCEARSLPSEIAFAVNLSIDELLTNTISYGYRDEAEHRIEIRVYVEGDAFVAVIVDDSEAFDVSEETNPELDASLQERSVGGLGLFLVHQMMDGVEYRRREGRNVVTLTKNLSPDGERAPD